jgi:hypothetical protein
MAVGEIRLSIEGISREDTLKYQEILHALVISGGLNVRAGSTTIHFDNQGIFQGIQVNYWPFKRR